MEYYYKYFSLFFSELMSMVVINIFLSWYTSFISPIIDLRLSLEKPIILTNISINQKYNIFFLYYNSHKKV